MKKLKKVTVAELQAQIWEREGVRVIFHEKPTTWASNYRYTRALNKTHTLSHLHDRISDGLQISFGLRREQGWTIVLGDGSINPRSDMHMKTARKSYA